MAAGAATIVLQPDHRSGTTWPGFHLVIEDVVGEDLAGNPVYDLRDLTDYDAAAQFRDEMGNLLMDLKLGDGITIPDPEAGAVYVDGPAEVLTAPPGQMVFDLKLTHPGGEKTVELDGSQTIIAGVTE